MTDRPITFIWSDAEQTMRPFGLNMGKRASERYGDGEIVRLVEHEERSNASHAHYFAVLHELFQSLPEKIRIEQDWAESEESMRKYALIKTGFYNEKVYACESAGEARRVAKWVEPGDEYAIMLTQGSIVRVFTAKSQSHRAMPNKGEFHKSKEAVLGFLADLIGLPTEAEERKP